MLNSVSSPLEIIIVGSPPPLLSKHGPGEGVEAQTTGYKGKLSVGKKTSFKCSTECGKLIERNGVGRGNDWFFAEPRSYLYRCCVFIFFISTSLQTGEYCHTLNVYELFFSVV